MHCELCFRKTIAKGERTMFLALVVFDAVLLWARLIYSVHAAVLGIIFGLATAGSAWLLFRPEWYILEERELCVQRRFPAREIRIPYLKIVECNPIGRFREFKKDADAAELLISYSVTGNGTAEIKKIVCHPENNPEFYSLLRDRCPAMQKRTLREVTAENDVLETLRRAKDRE